MNLNTVDLILFGVAGLAALVVPWVGSRIGGTGSHWGSALGLGASYAAFHWAAARPAFPPLDVTDRIAWLALAALILGVLESVRPGPAWTRWENRLLLAAVILWAMLGPVVAAAEDMRAEGMRLAALGGLFLAAWTNLEGLASRTSARAIGPIFAAVAGGAAGLFVATGSIVLGELAAGLMAGLILVWIASWVAPGLSLSRGGVPVVVTVLGGLLLNGYFYSSTPAPSTIILVAAPLAAWAGLIGPAARLAAWQRATISLVAVLIVVAIAIGLAVAESAGSGEGQ
jgi:hypothetical protein